MAQRIAVIVGTTEGIGDFLLRLPLVSAIKHAHPKCELWWLASYDTVLTHVLRPYTERFIDRVVDQLNLYEPPHRYLGRLRALPRFDIVFDTRTRILDVAVARMMLKPREFYCMLPGFFLASRRPEGMASRPAGNGARARAMALAAFGDSADMGRRLPVTPEAHALAAHDLPAGPAYVGLMPGSNQTRKNWPLQRFAAVARSLAEAGATPVFILGPVERPWLEALRLQAPNALFPDIKSLDHTMALMPRLTVALANDSGMGHLAATLDVPLLSLFGPTGDRYRPVGKVVEMLRAQDFGGEAMDAIPIEPVFARLKNLLRLAERHDHVIAMTIDGK